MTDKRRIPRRGFFRAAMNELIKPLENKAGPLQRALSEFSKLSGTSGSAEAGNSATNSYVRAPAGRTPRRIPLDAWIRPPGALSEQRFKEACTQCGDCIQACPVHAIRLETASRGGDRPFIDADAGACTMCDGLYCMPACPTGAMVPTPRNQIDMGTAEWHESTCVRTRHEECTACLDNCPVGSDAIQLRDGKIHVIAAGCTGCGSCQFHCPTSPKSITVIPKSAR